MYNISTEFFKTLEEAEAFQPGRVRWKDVHSLDKPLTVRFFEEFRDDAIAEGRDRSGFIENEARAVVVFAR